MAFPTTGVLDSFDRANEGPPPSASWASGSVDDATCTLKVVGNQCVDDLTSYKGGYYNTVYGPNCEAFVTLATPQNDVTQVTLYMRMENPGTGSLNGYIVRYYRDDASTGGISRIFRVDSDIATQLGTGYTDSSGLLSSGDKIGGEIIGDSITAYRFHSGAWSSLQTQSDATYTGSGNLGLRTGDALGAVVFDDFGGGTIAGGPTGNEYIETGSGVIG